MYYKTYIGLFGMHKAKHLPGCDTPDNREKSKPVRMVISEVPILNM